MKQIQVTTLGGGSAQSRLLELLLALRGLMAMDGVDLQIKSIVTVADDGGSAGRIRKLFGGPSLGDIGNLMAAVARNRDFAAIISARFGEDANAEPGLKGHKISNLLLDRGRKQHGSLRAAIRMLSQALDCQAEIIPSSLDSPTLCVRLSSDEVICGEHHLDGPTYDGTLQIKDVWLDPDADLNPDARQAILDSDRLIISAGDPYGSIAACLKVNGLTAALAESEAPVATIVPLFNRYGQSTGWNADDHIKFVQDLLGHDCQLTAAFVNAKAASASLVRQYASDHETQVDPQSRAFWHGVHLYQGDYLDETPVQSQEGDAIRRSSLFARHGRPLIYDLENFILKDWPGMA